EADAIVVNRIDEMPPPAVEELAGLVSERYPGTPVLRVSAKTGQGFESLFALLDQDGDFGRKILNIDYDIYAEGEAELGLLNSSVRLTATKPFALDELLMEVVQNLREAMIQLQGEVAHLKVI